MSSPTQNQFNPLTNAAPSRVDAVIQAVRDRAARRDVQVWDGIPSGGAGSGAFDNPKDLRVATPSTAADAAAWDRANPGKDGSDKAYTGVVVYTVRIGWDASTGELTQFQREALYDSVGMLVSLGPEVRTVIDLTETCS